MQCLSSHATWCQDSVHLDQRNLSAVKKMVVISVDLTRDILWSFGFCLLSFEQGAALATGEILMSLRGNESALSYTKAVVESHSETHKLS